MARILDIDLDFFLSKVHHTLGGSYGERLPSNEYKPWAADDVATFLSSRCKLSCNSPTPGRFYERHHEVHEHLRCLFNDHAFTPFELVHIDAHSDLGMGTDALVYITSILVHLDVEGRRKCDIQTKISEGNWLLFCLAEQILTSLTYVYHPTQLPNDIPWWLRLNNKDSLEIPILSQDECNNWLCHDGKLKPSRFEPPVPLHLCHQNSFIADTPFDYVFVTRSPEYTPKEADALLPVIQKYVASD